MEGVDVPESWGVALPRCVNVYIAFKYSTYTVVYLIRRNDLVSDQSARKSVLATRAY
jgi:hypothetical protein